MKSKVLFISATILLSILVTAQIANASLLDKILGRDPDLSPVPVTIDIINTPPTIIDIIEYPTGSGLNDPYTPIAGGTAVGHVLFIANDPNGAADLPDTPVVGANIGGAVTSPASNPGIQRLFTACVSFTCSTFPGICPNNANQKIYSCDFPISYSDPPSTFSVITPNANELWTISIQIADSSGTFGPLATSGDPGMANMPDDYIQINTLSAYSVSGSFSWSPGLSLTATNQPASTLIALTNQGNTPFITTSVTAADLTGVTIPTSKMSATAFSLSKNTGGAPPAECNIAGGTATQLSTSNIDIPNNPLGYTSTGTDTGSLYACAAVNGPLNTPGILTGSVDTQYAGTWQITLS